MSGGEASIDFALICDEILREENGKLVVVGVYGTDLVVPKMPATVRLSVLVSIRSASAGIASFGVRLLRGRQPIVDVGADFQFDAANERGLWSMGGILVTLGACTTLDLQVRVAGGRYRSYYRLPVKAG
jgi:hypothetical protein